MPDNEKIADFRICTKEVHRKNFEGKIFESARIILITRIAPCFALPQSFPICSYRGVPQGHSSQSELRLPLLQVVSNNKSFSVGVQSPTEINAPRGCAVILRLICQLTLTRITHQVSRAFDLIHPCASTGGLRPFDTVF